MSKQGVSPTLDVRTNKQKLEEVRAGFFARGETIKEWSEKRGFPYHIVRSVISGQRRCARGEAHKIAVELGLKKGVHLVQNGSDAPRCHRSISGGN